MIIPEGTDASAITPEQIREVTDAVITHSRHYDIPYTAIAKSIGSSAGVISEVLSGKYRGNTAKIMQMLQSWLIEDEFRQQRPETTQFVWTNVALAIKTVANYCLDYRSIGLVYGPDTSGMGKTTAARAIHQQLGPKRSALVTMDKTSATPTGLLMAICRAIGTDDGHASNDQRKERIIGKLRGRSHLLIIDQIHDLRFAKDDKPLYILAGLHDRLAELGGGAQLWIGTADMPAYLDKRRASKMDESLTQVRRRIFPQVDLVEVLSGEGGGGEPLVTIEQVSEMFAKNKLKLTAGGEKWLCKIANLADYGSVGLCKRVVEYATMVAEMAGAKRIDVPHLEEAIKRSVQPRLRDLLAMSLKTATQTRRTATG